MMYNAMYTQDHSETVDLSQNSFADGEDQLVVICGAFLVGTLFQAFDRMAAGFRLAVAVIVVPSRSTIVFPSRLIVAVSFVVP